MQAIVFHQKQMFSRNMFAPALTTVNLARDYQAVAIVNIPGETRSEGSFLSMVFQYTNSIDDHWSTNEYVTVLKEECRSTSVGDIVLTPDGVLHMCQMAGWGVVVDAPYVDETNTTGKEHFDIEVTHVVTMSVWAPSMKDAVKLVRDADLSFDATSDVPGVEVVSIDRSDDSTLSWCINGDLVDVDKID